MKNMIIEVEKDAGMLCPLNNSMYHCVFDEGMRCIDKIPAGCPLLEGDVVVRLKAK